MSQIVLASLALVLLCFSWSCDTSPERYHTALRALGFTHVELTGRAWFGCDGEEYNTRFSAISVSGQPVVGIVCCGVWKECTVRF